MRPFALLLILLLGQAQDTAKNLPVISAAEFKARREQLMAKLPDGLILMEADPLKTGMAGIDSNTPLYDYAYLTGYHSDGDIIALVPAMKTTILFAKDPDARKKTGIDEILPAARFEAFVKEVAADTKTIYTRLRGPSREIVTTNAPNATLKAKIPAALTEMRLIKSDGEMAMINKSTISSCKAHIAAMKACKAGMNEGAIQKVYEDTFKAEGCDGLSYPCIVGSGKNGIILHYESNKMDMPEDSLVVCDCGASYRGYATDITRTLPTAGKFNERQRTCYQAVLDAQKAAEKICKPGMDFRDLERAAQAVFTERDLDDWSYSRSTKGGPRHGLGHYVGLSVHDSGTYGEKFAPGMVITIEPGYYSKADGWGIRIEDLYLITKDGCERLTAMLPREIDEIEKLMKK